MKKTLFSATLLLLAPQWAGAETVYLESTRDNTLYESPSGRLSNGSGNHMFVGLTIDVLKRRSVVAFTDLETLPDGATITSVKLHLTLSQDNNELTPIRLHRLTSEWGEGASHAKDDEREGTNAEPNDATWVHTFWPSFPWSDAGGDFAETATAEMMVDSVGSYTFGPTVEMIGDVQQWVDEPSQNFGWALVGDETNWSLKRFDTRENETPENRPILEVEYTVTGSPFDFSGPWFDPARDGEGYLVFQTTAGWLIYFFGYTADGKTLWLISEVIKLDELRAGVPFELTMRASSPGTFEQPTPGSELPVYGTLSASFNDCTSGEFILNGPDGRKISSVIKLIGVDGTLCIDP